MDRVVLIFFVKIVLKSLLIDNLTVSLALRLIIDNHLLLKIMPINHIELILFYFVRLDLFKYRVTFITESLYNFQFIFSSLIVAL